MERRHYLYALLVGTILGTFVAIRTGILFAILVLVWYWLDDYVSSSRK